MSDETADEAIEDIALPEISDSAHASATLGITIQVGHNSAWPKFEFGDNRLPDETAEELIERVNSLTLEGAFNVAKRARGLMQEQSKQSKKQ